jgi:hypothetical protein
MRAMQTRRIGTPSLRVVHVREQAEKLYAHLAGGLDRRPYPPVQPEAI